MHVKNSLTSNNILVNDYLCSCIHNVVCKDLDMKSNIVELMNTPKLSIFDKNTASHLAMSLDEISGKPRSGIDLYSHDTSKLK